MSVTKQAPKHSFLFVITLIFFATANSFAQTDLVPYEDEATGLFGYTAGEGGKVKIEPQFEGGSPFNEDGIAKVRTKEKFALINKKGKLITQAVFDQIGWSDDPDPYHQVRFYNELCAYKSGHLWGLMDKKGKILLDPKFTSLDFFQNDMSVAGKNENGKPKLGLASINGEFIIPPLFDSVDFNPKEEFVKATRKDKSLIFQGLFNKQGKELVPCEFAEIIALPAQLFKVKSHDGFWGLFSTQKGKLFDAIFQEIGTFEEGKAIVKYKYRYGLIDSEGKTILDFKNKKISKKNGKYEPTTFPHYQLIDTEGKTLADFHYDSVVCKGPDTYQFFIDAKFGLIGTDEEIRFFDSYDSLGNFQQGCAVVSKNGNLGVIDSLGKKMIPLDFSAIRFEESGLIRCISISGKHDLFSFDGKNLTTGNFSVINEFSDGLYGMGNEGNMQFYDQHLQPVFKEGFQTVSPFQDGFAAIKKEGYFGIINRRGETVISPFVDSLIVINKNYFVFYDNEEWGTVNTNGIELAHLSSSVSFERMAFGCLKLKEGNQYGMLNKYGTQILPIAYDSISDVSEDQLVKVYLKGKSFFMDTEAREVPSGLELAKLEIMGEHSEKYFPFKLYGTYGFVDYMGRLRVTARYDGVSGFSQGLCGIKLGGKWGYMNKLEKIIIQPKYFKISPFDADGHAMVTNREGKVGVIDRNERFILQMSYERIEKNEYGRFIIWQNGKPGIIDITTMENILPLYESIVDCGNRQVIIQRRGKFGVNRINGETIAYPAQDKVEYNPLANNYFLVSYSSSF